MNFVSFLIRFVFVVTGITLAQKPCIPKIYPGNDNALNCVCNSTYCDEPAPIGNLGPNDAAVYTSSQSGKRLERTSLTFGNSGSRMNSIKIQANTAVKNQTIFGFGGAFTDYTGWNIAKLNAGAQQNLLRTYFDPDSGIGYTIGRVPMASCDYSLKIYSYDDTPGDLQLLYFKLDQEDYNYKIPFIQQANAFTGNKLKLFASPWSAPFWMKDTGYMRGGGHLIGDVNGPYYQTWANYFVKFFQAYAANNITFWGVTMQNEPTTAIEDPGHNETRYFQAMYFNSTMERDFAKGTWGPVLRNNSVTKNLKLMMMDDNRVNAPQFSDAIYTDPVANHYIDGMAVHWYYDGNLKPEVFTQIHEKYPNKFIMYTEACQNPPTFGAWHNGDNYMHYIIPVLNNWVNAWTDWNMVLDQKGGNGSQIATIFVNSTEEFEKQPMFYAQGHLSKFIVPDSVVVGFLINDQKTYTYQNLEGVAALTPNGQKVVVLNNRDGSANYAVSIVNDQGNWINLNLEPHSFTSIVYN